MSKDDETSDLNEKTSHELIPLERIKEHMLFSYSSFENLKKNYLIISSTLTILVITSLKVGNMLVFISKFDLIGSIGQGWVDFRNNIILSASLTVGSIFLWAILMHSMLSFMGGKGKFLRSFGIYCVSNIPIAIGDLILLIVAFTQPTILADGNLDPGSYFELTYTHFVGHNLATSIVVPITVVYSNLIAGVGMSAEHKAPELLGWISGGIIAIFSIILRFVL